MALNTAITRENLPSLRDIYERAKQWGVSISYSAYTPLRTHSMDHYIRSADDLALLRQTLDELLALKAQNGRIANSPWTLSGIHDFFLHGTIPGCKAGRRFMVVTPTGGLRAVLDVREYLRLAHRKSSRNGCPRTSAAGATFPFAPTSTLPSGRC